MTADLSCRMHCLRARIYGNRRAVIGKAPKVNRLRLAQQLKLRCQGWLLMISPTVYILACKPHNTLYIGSTSNLSQRVWQHRNDLVDGFCAEYSMHTLVHFEQYDDMSTAICRERLLKRWNRAWKMQLIKAENPKWEDLYFSIL
jgi:putative endonuclease